MDELITIVIVDGHAIAREGLQVILGQVGDLKVIECVGTADEGARAITSRSPAVALVDERLPDGNGIELIREMKAKQPSTRCVVLAPVPDDESLFHAVVAGASGYLLMDIAAEELVSAVRRVADGESIIGPELIADLRERERESEPSRADDLLSELSPQERRIMRMVTEGLTNREIGDNLSLAEKTVRNYVSAILGKLGMRNRTQLATYVARTARFGGR